MIELFSQEEILRGFLESERADGYAVGFAEEYRKSCLEGVTEEEVRTALIFSMKEKDIFEGRIADVTGLSMKKVTEILRDGRAREP